MAGASKPAVLIVEDDLSDVLFLELELRKFGVETTTVKTVSDAKSKLSEQAFSLCLLDLNLPDSPPNPVDLVDALTKSNPLTPIAIVTGSLEDVALRQVLEKKVLAVWLKPVTYDQLAGVFTHES